MAVSSSDGHCVKSKPCYRDGKPSVTSEGLVKQLKQCGVRKDLAQGRLLHGEAIHSGLCNNMYVSSTLVSMYSQCGSMDEARDTFDRMPHRDAVSWNVLILGYVNNAQSSAALEVFGTMDCPPNAVTFVAALRACTQLGDVEKGKTIHEQSKQHGLDRDVFVASTLVNMYGKCGDMSLAHLVFDTIGFPNAVSWTNLMLGYLEKGEIYMVLELFTSMNCAPDRVALVTALRACSGLEKEACLCQGSMIHGQAQELGLDKDVFVASALVDMYSKSGNMSEAQRVFDGMKSRDVIAFNVLILGYLEHGQSLRALEAFHRMDCPPNSVTILAALRVNTRLAAGNEAEREIWLEKGVRIHELAGKLGFDKDIQVANTLIDMYTKCGDMTRAQDVFNRISKRSVVSWTSLLLGYLENGHPYVALEVFGRLDCEPNNVILAAALKACVTGLVERESCLRTGLALHRQAIELGLDGDVVVASGLLDMYSKLGNMTRARCVFDGMADKTVVSWTALVLGYVENGEFCTALEIFECMDCVPDYIIFVAALKACVGLGSWNKEKSLLKGENIYEQTKQFGCDENILVRSTMISLYRKCNDMNRARQLFDRMDSHDAVSLSTLMFGYIENGMSSHALEVFHRIDCSPNRAVFVAALKACGSLGALKTGQGIHDHVCRYGFEEHVMVVTSLVDFYGKCSMMVGAELVFYGSDSASTVLWNGFMGGYSAAGESSRVLDLVKRMNESSVQPDSVTLQLILTACSHVGAVSEGLKQLERMSEYHGVEVTMEQYGCVVDMLGRSNKLEEALKVITGMPFQANSVIWSALLSSCERWSNVQIARLAFVELVALDEDKDAIASAHVLLRNMFERLGASDMLLDRETRA